MFDFSNYSAKSKNYDDLNKLVFDKMKDEAGHVAIEKLFGLNSKMYLFLLDSSGEHEKEKGVNKNIAATVSHNVIMNTKIICWNKKVWDFRWIESKIKIAE